MSIAAAKQHAQRALQETTATEKLDEIARAIYEIARKLDDLESDIRKLK